MTETKIIMYLLIFYETKLKGSVLKYLKDQHLIRAENKEMVGDHLKTTKGQRP